MPSSDVKKRFRFDTFGISPMRAIPPGASNSQIDSTNNSTLDSTAM